MKKMLKLFRYINNIFFKKKIDPDIIRFMVNNPIYNKYSIGKYSYGFPKVYDWDDGSDLKIGKYCSIGDKVSLLLGGEHQTDFISTYPFQSFSNEISLVKDRKTKGDILIGNDVWIGNNVLILSGITIGNGAVIGAGSVVTKNIDSYSIVAGNPAKLIKKRFSEIQVSKLNSISWWYWDENKIEKHMKEFLSSDIEKFILNNYEK